MTFFDLAMRRESCRSYSKRPVPHQLLTELVKAAILSPSAGNRQSWRFAICEGKSAEAVGKLCMAVPGNNPWAADCPAFIVISSTTRVSTILGKAHEFPVADAGIAAAYLCLAAAEAGLGTCIVGAMDEEGVKALLGIEAERRVHLIVAVGYPAAPSAGAAKKNRLSFEELVTCAD